MFIDIKVIHSYCVEKKLCTFECTLLHGEHDLLKIGSNTMFG